MIVVEGTERSQQNARLRLAWLALRARNQALAYGSRGSRFALAIKRKPALADNKIQNLLETGSVL